MPIPVRAVLWEPSMPGLPLSDHEWQMFELPSVGSHYWHDKTGYRVERIEEIDGETRVHLIRDSEWEEEMSEPLPDVYLVAGGRNADDGNWHFQVVGPRGVIGGRVAGYGPDLEPAIREAVAAAVAHLGLAPGEQP